ncbi:glycine cleavage system aminomethyltransferase GcvT [Oceanispirochaeta sp.]|jgi:glycine cleavage system T protein|uniref:glycine cleavage system aminomethyltransferase GcvT n=1 Tax=Oceanispirochaeta sp. TaxID=2035350 RepID=UPI00262EC42C|nr:glycine cleavage system aminomethyltransferase GcvT [Oceanispirochaeta sp.]MDA3957410.1 glycine cleavage system aminomethyltransferase GcvT [Oceanispirochaeta sp.]
MLKTAINSFHRDQDARMVEYAGWDMPLFYASGATEEHRIVRRSAGLFDVSHMGRFRIKGSGSADFLNHLISSDVKSLPIGLSGYGLLLNPQGGIIDDVFLYHIAAENYLLVVNASNLEKDWQWLEKHKDGYDIILTDESPESSLFALQGPRVIPVLETLTGLSLQNNWERFGVREFILENIPFLAGRTGYTGEDGVEIFVANEQALALWKIILKNFSPHCEISPCGLACRDSLRFEPGFPLYGHELNETILPPQALLKWACHMEGDFIGKEAVTALLEKGVEKKLITLSLVDKGVPREGYDVLSSEGEVIGQVVSGLYAPTVDKYCANAFVPLAYSKAGTEIQVSL